MANPTVASYKRRSQIRAVSVVVPGSRWPSASEASPCYLMGRTMAKADDLYRFAWPEESPESLGKLPVVGMSSVDCDDYVMIRSLAGDIQEAFAGWMTAEAYPG